ncbi:hypothetical protein C8024_15275 [Sphingopyxis sp. BSNA05]|uniref:hypothetical protein n=1 Tax=Sphingopyxis sp. BSNA05 TaxID=1236614 RepID=UPI00156366A1|nr:hypothetical protein [Sphingopyxis sp. BSNA05]NRD90528.1 hypothetical protein [Sphingopyxis sp. BSNA05]
MDRSKHNDIVRRASAMADKASFVADDFAQALFPKSEVIFNDRMRSNAQQYLRSVVEQIEKRICTIVTGDLGVSHDLLLGIAQRGNGQSFAMLEQSGLLKTSEIVRNLFVKTQQSELAARLLQKISQEDLESTLTRHLDHADPAVAKAAMGLLVAQSKTTGATGEIAASLADLSPEIAYAFAWPITAALVRRSGFSGPQLQQATERLLAAHDESAGVARKAERLAQLLDQAGGENISVPHPMRDGLTLFIARLARQSGLTSDQIVAFTAEPDMARLVVVMRAADFPVQEALSIFAALDGGDHILTGATYGETDRDRCQTLVTRWASPEAFQNAERLLSDDFPGSPGK